MKIKIFLFHRVSPIRDPLWNPMTPKLFEQIINYLNQKYEIVPLEKTLLDEFHPIGKKALCAITFDDGYKDFVDYAFPILIKYKSPSSMYIVTDCVENNIPPWTYIINHLFINTSHLSLDLYSKALSPKLQKTKWKNQKERLHYAKKLSPFLKQLNNQERKLIYDQILTNFNDVDMPEGMMMDWNDVRYVSQNGCEIGSHTITHPLLAKKINAGEISRELVESGKIIERQIGKFPIVISYPFGNYNESIKKNALHSGYKFGITVNHNVYDSQVNDLFEIPRAELYSEPFFKSKLRINGIINKISNVLRITLLIGLFDV